ISGARQMHQAIEAWMLEARRQPPGVLGRRISSDMQLAAADFHVDIQIELPDLPLDLAPERKGPEGVRAGDTRGQQTQYATELRPPHVEGELGLPLGGADALDITTELALGTAEVVHAELTQGQVPVRERARDAHLADRLAAPDQSFDAGIQVRVEA